MAIFRATSELGYSALRPKKELAKRHFLQGSNVFVSLPTGSGKSSCYCLLSRAFDFLRQCTALRESKPQAVYAMDRITSNLGETHRATCPFYRKHRLPPVSKVPKKSLEERYVPMAEKRRCKANS